MTPKDREADRLTVSLPAKLASELRYEGQRTNRPVSNIVRDAVQQYLEQQPALPLPSFVGVGRSEGPSDASTRVDELVLEKLLEDDDREKADYEDYLKAHGR